MIPDGITQAISDVGQGVSSWPLVLCGSVGSGKTFAAVALLDAVGGGCRYYSLAEMCDELIQANRGELYWGSERITAGAFWADWRKRRCAVIDEIGARHNVSDFSYETLKRAIDERERVAAPLVCISNLSLSDIGALYDDRIASRLAAGTLVEIEGDDRRLTGN